MGYKSVLTKIDELREIVASWRNGEEPALIEKDMALERVKSIYEMLRFPSEESEMAEEPEVNEEQESEAQAAQTSQPEEETEEDMKEESAPEVEVELIFEEEENEDEDEVEDVKKEEENEEECEEEDLSLDLINVTNIEGENSEDSDMIDRESFLRELEAVSQKKRERLSKILSLYDDEMPENRDDATEEEQQEVAQEEQPSTEDIPEPCIEESVEVEPSIEPGVEPGVEPSIEPGVELNEEQSEEAESQTIMIESTISIISTLGINDRLLLLQELFGGDDELLVKTLEALSMQSTIDDAMIYIAENHSWSGDNEGAQLLMSLLQTRYQS